MQFHLLSDGIKKIMLPNKEALTLIGIIFNIYRLMQWINIIK